MISPDTLLIGAKRNHLDKAAYIEWSFIYGQHSVFEEHDREFSPYLHPLLLHLFMSRHVRTVHKTEAMRLIPVKHTLSAQKYIDIATSRGWVELASDPEDRRKITITLSEKAQHVLEQHFGRLLLAIFEITGEIKNKGRMIALSSPNIPMKNEDQYLP